MWAILLMTALAGMVHGGMKLVVSSASSSPPSSGSPSRRTTRVSSPLPCPASRPPSPVCRRERCATTGAPGTPRGHLLGRALGVFPMLHRDSRRRQSREFAQRPEVSIPWGTLAAVSISAVMYSTCMIMWGAVADRAFLKGGPAAVYAAGDGHRRRLLAAGATRRWAWCPRSRGPRAPDADRHHHRVTLAGVAVSHLRAEGAERHREGRDGSVLNVAAPLNAAGRTRGGARRHRRVLSRRVHDRLSISSRRSSPSASSPRTPRSTSRRSRSRLTRRPRGAHVEVLPLVARARRVSPVHLAGFRHPVVLRPRRRRASRSARGVHRDGGRSRGLGKRPRRDSTRPRDERDARPRARAEHSSNWRPQLLCLPGWPYVDADAAGSKTRRGTRKTPSRSRRRRCDGATCCWASRRS